VPIGRQPLPRRGLAQKLVQILFLLGKAEHQPLREYLVVAMAQNAVGLLRA